MENPLSRKHGLRAAFRSCHFSRQAVAAGANALAIAGIRLLVVALLSMPLAANTLIDANTASEEQLQSIAGIGPATAQKIIQTRQKKPFKDLRDFADRVPGIGPKRLQQYSDAGLVVKRISPMQTASASQSTRHPTDPTSAKVQEPEQSAIPVISVIEGGLRESHGRQSIK
jgi:competence protein ComEA